MLGLDELADPVASLGGLVAGKHLGGDVDNLANLDVRNLRLVLFTRRAEQAVLLHLLLLLRFLQAVGWGGWGRMGEARERGEGIAFGFTPNSLALMRKPSMQTASVPPLLFLPFLASDGGLFWRLVFTFFLAMVFLAAPETNEEGE